MAIYLEIEGCPGNVTAKGYEEHISVDSCSFGVSRGISMDPGNMSNREATRPALSEISLSKPMDNSCINLFKQAVGGVKGVPAKIKFVRTSAEGVEEYLVYELENCLVSGYSISAQADGGEPIENISLSYTKFMCQYKDSDETHSKHKQQVAGYNLTTAGIV